MTKLYEASNHILICTESIQPAEHCHMAAHILLSMDGCIHVQAAGKSYRCNGIVIPSGMPHTVDTCGNRVLAFVYDCTTDVAKQIREILCIPEEICKDILPLYGDLEQNCTFDGYSGFENTVLGKLGITGAPTCVQDGRILSAMDYIRCRSTEELTCREVADAVHLSQSRFSHLFREQVGMTFAAYLIYQRILYVYTRMLSGRSITQSALEAGFSSSGHFADVNRRVFGLSATAITREMEFIKVR